MKNPPVFTHDCTFTIDEEILVTGITFTRQNGRSSQMVHLFGANHDQIMRFNDTVKLDWSQRHEDLLMRLPAGQYSVIGMIPGDTLEIQWKLPTPKPEPVIVDMSQIEIDRKRNFTRHNLFLVPVPGAAKDYPNVSPHLQ